MSKYRLRFTKNGRAVYISHLDLMHTLQRAFSRAGLELKYSEGFNPHPSISIAMPLSVGTASCCEILDFQLISETEPQQIAERLNAVLPEGIRVEETYLSERKASLIRWLEVEGRLDYDAADTKSVLPRLKDFFGQESIVISKKSKRGIVDMDIVPAIRQLCFAEEKDGVRLNAVLSVNEPTLNPDLLVDALLQLAPELCPDFCAFERKQIFDAEMQVFR